MTIYALTLTWCNRRKLQKLYESLLKVKDTLDCDLKWLIRDNNSTDDTNVFVPYWNQDLIHYYKYNTNSENFSQGNNYLFNKAKGLGLNSDDFILLLNDDIEFKDSNSLNKMLALFSDKVAIVGSRLLFPDGRLQHAGVVFVQNDKGKFPHNYRSGSPDDDIARINREFQAVTGACMLVRAKYLQSTLLNEALSWGYEDVDLCLRMVSRQKRVLYCGETEIIHDESSSLNKNHQNQNFFFKNLVYFNRQWGGKFDVDISKYDGNKSYKAV